MSEKIISAVDKFLGKTPDKTQNITKKTKYKTEVKSTNDIIEHVDKKLVLEDGRQLLL